MPTSFGRRGHAAVCGLRGCWISRIPRGDAPPRAPRHANRPSEACAHMNICVRCGACGGWRRRHALRWRHALTFRVRLIDACRFTAVQYASMWLATTKGTAATFAVFIKAEAASSSLGRTALAWSLAWRESATQATKSSASPAPCRAKGAEEDEAQVEQIMASDVWRYFIWRLLCYVSFTVFN